MTVGPNDPQDVVGTVQRLDVSGFGPNSGEITLVIQPDAGDAVEVFAGIMDSSHSSNANENSVFASYVTMATAALTTGRQLHCSYLVKDKPRINWLSLRS